MGKPAMFKYFCALLIHFSWEWTRTGQILTAIAYVVDLKTTLWFMLSCEQFCFNSVYLIPSSKVCSGSNVREVCLLVIVHLDKPKPSMIILSYIFSLVPLIKK